MWLYRIKPRRRSADFDRMPEDFLYFRRVGNDHNDFHQRVAFGTLEGVHIINLGNRVRPCGPALRAGTRFLGMGSDPSSLGRASPMDLLLIRSGSLDVRSVCPGASSIRENHGGNLIQIEFFDMD